MLLILYDGECPFCSHYVQRLHVQAHCGEVKLVDARLNDATAQFYWQQGYNLDEGMIALWDDRVYYGADAVNLLAQLADPDDVFNRLHRWLMAQPKMAGLFYPLFKRARRLALAFKGSGPLVRP